MEEVTIPRNDGKREWHQVLAQYGAPAFVRRARAVEEAEERLRAACRRARGQMLEMVRLSVGRLFALAGDPSRLRTLLADDAQLEVLHRLHQETAPQLRDPVPPTASQRRLRQALRELTDSLERFNRRWQAYLASVDLAPVNQIRDGYNRHYLLEKECVLGSARVARDGFRRLDSLTLADLAAWFPPVAVPTLAGSA